MARWAAFVCVVAAAPLALAQAEEAVFVGAGGVELRGTLLLPEGAEERAPALLLLPGSGPTDRDGNQRPALVTDLLKQVAERLAREGIATLRFDKRATAGHAALWPSDAKELDAFFAFENFVGDAEGARRYLLAHGRIDAARVGVLGHSEGGLIALQLAHGAPENQRPAALILAGTAGRPLDVVMHEQVTALLRRQTTDEAVRRRMTEAMESAIAAVKAREPLPAGLPAGLRPLFNDTVLSLLHSYFTIDPAALAGSYDGPVLVVQGEEDVQVSAERDTPLLEAALKARAEGSTKVLVVEGASHNLKVLSGEADPGVAGPVAPEALDGIAAWAREALGPAR